MKSRSFCRRREAHGNRRNMPGVFVAWFYGVFLHDGDEGRGRVSSEYIEFPKSASGFKPRDDTRGPDYAKRVRRRARARSCPPACFRDVMANNTSYNAHYR